MEWFTPSKIVINTCVANADLKSTLDLDAIYNNLVVSDIILGLKYNNRIKGVMNISRSFFNQASISIYIEECYKTVNNKMFKNGKLQLSGIKNKHQASLAISEFIKQIIDISGIQDIQVIVVDDIIYHKEDYNSYINLKPTRYNYIRVYGYEYGINGDSFVPLGVKKDKLFILENGYKVELRNGVFLELKHHNFIKKIFSIHTGKEIGYCEYKLLRKKKNLILYDCIYTKISDNTFNIIDKWGNVKGTMEYNYNYDDTKDYTNNDDITNIKVKYNAINNEHIREILNKLDKSNFNDIISLEIVNINAMFNLNLIDCRIDKNNLYYMLTQTYKHLVSYDTTKKNPTVKLILYFDKKESQLLLTKRVTYNKLIHKKVTTTIFPNGKIIISGCKELQQIVIIKNYICKILHDNYNTNIIHHTRVNDAVFVVNPNISILDLM